MGLPEITMGSVGGEAWAAAVVRACCQGGLYAAGAYLLCRLMPRLPAGVRCAVWWLVCAKMVTALAFSAAIPLPVLPVSSPSPSPALSSPNESRPGDIAAEPSALRGPDRTGVAGEASEHEAPDSLPGSRKASPWSGALLMAWCVGVVVSLLAGLRSFVKLRRLYRCAIRVPVGDGLVRLAGSLGLRRLPRVVESSWVTTPLVTGLFRPVVVLPAGWGGVAERPEVRMALAHELAHLRRGDLWWGLVPSAAQALFFFFPPVWLACREYAAAREEACDALALRVTGSGAAQYGRLLLLLAEHGAGVCRAALPMASGFRTMKRRLLALRAVDGAVSPALRRTATALLAAGALLVLPWRLTAFQIGAPADPVETASIPRYGVTDLGTLGGKYSYAYAVNNRGQVVGSANADDDTDRGRAFLWENGRFHDLGVLDRTSRSIARDISDEGRVVATSYNAARYPHSFLWQGRRRYLGVMEGFRFSKAIGINDRGQVVGNALTGTFDGGAEVSRAFLWGEAPGAPFGRMRDLGTLGGPYSHAFGVNDRGQVVGKADLPRELLGGTQTHAFLWEDDTMQDLGTLPGGRNSLASALNERAQVVGWSQTHDTVRAFLWQNDEMLDLGVLPGGTSSRAHAINEAGYVVGSCETDAGFRAVLWVGDRIVDLNDLLPKGTEMVLEEARAINDRNQIAGSARIDGRRHAFLLTPITDPAPLASR